MLLQLLDRLLLEYPLIAPLAVGAAQEQLPLILRGLVPLNRLHQRGVTAGAEVEGAGGRGGAPIVEPHHFNLAAAGKNDSVHCVMTVALVHVAPRDPYRPG